MATAPLSWAALQEAAAALERAGSAIAAAREIGLNLNTFRHRMREYRRRLPTEGKPAEVVKPMLPDPNEPIEDWLSRREAEQARRKQAADARKWMPFAVKGKEPFGLAFVGDPHIDDDGCDLSQLRADLKLIETTPRLYGVGMGDWINNWTRRLGHLYGQQRTSESDAYRAMEWLLKLPIWMLLLKGNHDLWSGSGNALRWMAGSVPVEDWRADFAVTCAGAEWRISAAHDFPGHSQWNKAHGPLKRAMFSGAQASLYVAGHKHTWTLLEDEDEHSGRTFWAARVRGYKMMDSYAVQLGFGEQQRGHSLVAVCDPADGSMTCFSSVVRGARYLALLQESRAKRTR